MHTNVSTRFSCLWASPFRDCYSSKVKSSRIWKEAALQRTSRCFSSFRDLTSIKNCVHSFHSIDHDLLTKYRFILLTATMHLLSFMCDCKQYPCIIFDISIVCAKRKRWKISWWQQRIVEVALSNQTTKKN